MSKVISEEEFQKLNVTIDPSLDLSTKVIGIKTIVPNINLTLRFYVEEIRWRLKSLETITDPYTRQSYLEAIVVPNENTQFLMFFLQPLYPVMNNAVDRARTQIMIQVNNMENFENYFNFNSSVGTLLDADNVGFENAINRYKKVLAPDNNLLIITSANNDIFDIDAVYVKRY